MDMKRRGFLGGMAAFLGLGTVAKATQPEPPAPSEPVALPPTPEPTRGYTSNQIAYNGIVIDVISFNRIETMATGRIQVEVTGLLDPASIAGLSSPDIHERIMTPRCDLSIGQLSYNIDDVRPMMVQTDPLFHPATGESLGTRCRVVFEGGRPS